MSLIANKKVKLNYEILEKIEAGIELFGYEVKSLRKGEGSLDGARVVERGGEAFVIGMNIPAFQPKNAPKDYDAERSRRLLLKHEEILKLKENEKVKGLTLVPISVYNKGRVIKIEIAIVRGKKKFDKREDIKKRDTERDIRREMRSK